MRPSKCFFEQPVDEVARALIGAVLLVNGVGGRIVETESYDADDPASHAYQMRRTARNATMLGPPARAYVYRSYGIHWCLNFVCEPGSAVLIRALEPLAGIEAMRRRRGTMKDSLLCAGPGRLCEALGIDRRQDGASLLRKPFALSLSEGERAILVGPRIGLTKAAERRRRFGEKGSLFLSRRFVEPS
ncbi:MAG TPA: DNA-3-methyladenine glycosylase [Candidatus Polarisedimenticolia bacterium]|nr:DNA-3-methyladenine glycosylase [Candidatus Polarisedimenticolia bacterium]